MKCALYCRVSTADKQSPEMQLSELRACAASRGFVITKEYIDHGFSGGTTERPEFQRMLTDIRTHQFEVVLVWRLDRLSRSLKDLINTTLEFEAYGVKLISHKDNIDLSTPAGKLQFHVFGAMAEFERALIRERVIAGMEEAKRKGKQLHRPKGSKDKKPRSKQGYLKRWEKFRAMKAMQVHSKAIQ